MKYIFSAILTLLLFSANAQIENPLTPDQKCAILLESIQSLRSEIDHNKILFQDKITSLTKKIKHQQKEIDSIKQLLTIPTINWGTEWNWGRDRGYIIDPGFNPLPYLYDSLIIQNIPDSTV